MSKKEKLLTQIKRIFDQSPRADWTADMVLKKHEANIREAFAYDPGLAPASPSLAGIRTVLSTLVEMDKIELTINRDGSRRFHTYERIIPEPLIKIEYRHKHRPYAFWVVVVLAPAVFGFASGWMT